MTIAGSLPRVVTTRDDVLAILPGEYKRAVGAPVRDAIADALLALLVKAQDDSDFAAAQSDPNRAVGAQEDGLFEDRGVPRSSGEQDEDYRDRALAVPRPVTFSSIRDATNAILAPVTAARCQISDMTLDRWFIGDAATRTTRTWHSYVNRGPNYPERFFEHNVPNNPNGLFVVGNDPGGIRVGNDTVGREFLIRVPDLTGLVDAKITVGVHATGFFIGNGSYRLAAISGGQFATSVYEAIVSTVNVLVGHSVRWILLADPKLV